MPEISDLQKDSKALTRRSQVQSIRSALEKQAIQLKNALPPNISTKRFLRVVYTQLHKNPQLQECTKESLVASVFTAAERALMPNGEHAALVPYWNSEKRCREAQYQAMYKGLIHLAKKFGDVADVMPGTIHENDKWSYELGMHADLRHTPAQHNRGAPIGYYAIIERPDGKKSFGPGIMFMEEMEKFRKPKGPWVNHPESMCWKTVIKRNLKYIGASPELQEHLMEDDELEYGDMQIDQPAYDEPEAEPEPELPVEKQPEWPMWDKESQCWRDSAAEAYHEERHLKPMRVNKDGTFTKRRVRKEPQPINEDGTIVEGTVENTPDIPSGEPGPDVPW